ncbi:MAG: type II secretion system major pseudopilin GspG [Phycisphaerales bacterium]
MKRRIVQRAARRHRRGFTLIEVMIAIAIVVALIAIVGINVIGQRDTANVGQARAQMRNIEAALDNFYLAFNRYPTDDEGLEVLWNREALDFENEEDEQKWQRFLNNAIPRDVWGNEWGYRAESEFGRRYDLWSNGPDGEEGTDDDITSWTAEDEAGGFGGM